MFGDNELSFGTSFPEAVSAETPSAPTQQNQSFTPTPSSPFGSSIQPTGSAPEQQPNPTYPTPTQQPQKQPYTNNQEKKAVWITIGEFLSKNGQQSDLIKITLNISDKGFINIQFKGFKAANVQVDENNWYNVTDEKTPDYKFNLSSNFIFSFLGIIDVVKNSPLSPTLSHYVICNSNTNRKNDNFKSSSCVGHVLVGFSQEKIAETQYTNRTIETHINYNNEPIVLDTNASLGVAETLKLYLEAIKLSIIDKQTGG